MIHAKHLAGIYLSALLLSGCASSGGTTASLESYQKAHNEANTAIKAAVMANNVWRDSRKILNKAEKAAKAGDYETATKLALKAKRQGELAVVQAESQKNAGPM